MSYIAKLWLNKKQYLAVLDNAIVIVTEDGNGKAIRWHIFEGDGFKNGKEIAEWKSTLETTLRLKTAKSLTGKQ